MNGPNLKGKWYDNQWEFIANGPFNCYADFSVLAFSVCWGPQIFVSLYWSVVLCKIWSCFCQGLYAFFALKNACCEATNFTAYTHGPDPADFMCLPCEGAGTAGMSTFLGITESKLNTPATSYKMDGQRTCWEFTCWLHVPPDSQMRYICTCR